MTTNTKPALTFADQIAVLEQVLQSVPKSTANELENDYLHDLNEKLGEMLQQMKDWPAELITKKLRESLNTTIQAVARHLQEEKICDAFHDIDKIVEVVLPALSTGDGLEARLKIAEEVATWFFIDCTGFGMVRNPYQTDPYVEAAWPYFTFGMEIKDNRKWGGQLAEKVMDTCDELEKQQILLSNYRSAVQYEESNRKKLGIDPDVELSEQLLEDKLTAMKEAKPDAHPNTIASWKRARGSLRMLVRYTVTPEQKVEES